MSANRSVQSAQRRRSGPTNSEPAIPGRGPQPSINSSQMFANQVRPGQGSNISTGRLAGQQAAIQQHQMEVQPNNKLSSVTKMTIPQAITLITLRLGVLESKLTNMTERGHNLNSYGESEIDTGFLQSIMERLETIEKRPVSTTGSISPELKVIKQQFETVKQTTVQSRTSIINLAKENVSLKTQLESLKNELTDTKELVNVLQNLAMDNSKKILDLSIGKSIEYECDFDESNMVDLEEETETVNFNELQQFEQNEIIETDLKQLIESELNNNDSV